MTTNSIGTAYAEGHGRIHVGDAHTHIHTHDYKSGPGLALPTVPEAEFDSFAEQHNARCYKGTRAELLCQIKNWANDPHGEVIFWLNGMAGTGKSTISRTVAKAFAEDSLLGASFFFKRGESNRGNAALFFPTIAKQLVRKIPALDPYVREAINTDQAVGKALDIQFDRLILQPLSHIQHVVTVMVVIDALDECDGDKDVKSIIFLLARASALPSARLRFFITSRPELPIRLGFRNVQGKYENLALHQIPKPTVERDISTFLEHEFARIRDTYNGNAPEELGLPRDWPGSDVIRTLTQMAVPLFIFAATICRFVEDAYSDPCAQLKEVLKYQTKTHDSELDKLDATYLPVLSQLTVGRLDPQKKRSLTEFRDIVGPIVLLAQPLSMSSLARLLDIPLRAVSNTLNPLHSVLSIPPKVDSPIRLFHLSLRDFLVDPAKGAGEFWIDETKYHGMLWNRCIQLMRQHLKRDICGLRLPGKLRSEVDQQIIDAALPPDAQYACRHWVYHLKESKSSIQDGDPVHNFLTSHLLHWLESLGLLGHITESIGMTEDLLTLIDPADAPELSAFLHDTKRLVLSNRLIIDTAPLQVYVSALVFCPTRSVIRNQFEGKELQWIAQRPLIADNWSACLMTLEGLSRSLSSVAWSQDGTRLAAGSGNMVQIWDAATGQSAALLEGHRDDVGPVAWSPDAARLASASEDDIVKIWDVATLQCTATIKIYHGPVNLLAWSPDATRLASACDFGKVDIWDPLTGECLATLKGHEHHVYSVAWSPNTAWLASAADDSTIKIWDMTSHQCIASLEGQELFVYSVAWSQDGTQLASASNEMVKIWDTATRQCVATLEGHHSFVKSVAWSPDATQIASASDDKTVKIWDTATSQCTATLEGHDSYVRSVAWSPDARRLASASRDKTVRIWDTSTGQNIALAESDRGPVEFIAFSPNTTWVVSAPSKGMATIWNSTTGHCVATLEGQGSDVDFGAWSPDATWFAGSSSEKTVKVWETATGRCIATLDGHPDETPLVAWSPVRAWLAWPSAVKTVKIWDAVTGRDIATLEGHHGTVNSVAWSPDGTLLASASVDKTVKVWDPPASQCIATLEGHHDSVFLMAWSPDVTQLASTSEDKTIRVWDIATSQCVATLEGHGVPVISVVWLQGATWLASGSKDYVIKIWHPTTRQCMATLKGYGIPGLGVQGILRTNLGTFDLRTVANPTVSSSASPESLSIVPVGYGVDSTRSWITYQGENLVWLPLEYRPSCVDFSENLVSIGCKSGRVLNFSFSDSIPFGSM